MNREVRHVCVTHTTCVFYEIPILHKDVNIYIVQPNCEKHDGHSWI